MATSLTIRARLNEGVDANGIGFPESVTINGAHMLTASALADMAQSLVDEYMEDHPDTDANYRVDYTKVDVGQHTAVVTVRDRTRRFNRPAGTDDELRRLADV